MLWRSKKVNMKHFGDHIFINLHFSAEGKKEERFDTMISPNGSIASLEYIQRNMGIASNQIFSVDGGGYENAEETGGVVFHILREHIQDSTRERMAIICVSLLQYNLGETVAFLDRLLAGEFASRVHVVLGGQLVSAAGEWRPNLEDPHPLAFRNDVLRRIEEGSLASRMCYAEGDGEVLFPEVIKDLLEGNLKRRYRSLLQSQQYAPVSYESFVDLDKRFERMSDVAGFKQLVVQGPGGPGCAWAMAQGEACSFCALQNITTKNHTSLEKHFAHLKMLQDTHKFGPQDRFFDVANQFIPYMGRSQQIAWLREYIEERNKAGVHVKTYAYLTVNSIDIERAELLKEAGVTEVYLGVDHFHRASLEKQKKSHRAGKILERCFEALHKTGITARIGIVLGVAPETHESLATVEDGIYHLLTTYPGTIKAVGLFPIEIIPGSSISKGLYDEGLYDGPSTRAYYSELFQLPEEEVREKLETLSLEKRELVLSGDRELQHVLTRIYIAGQGGLPYSEIMDFVERLNQQISEYAIGYSYDLSPDKEGDVLRG